MRWLETTSITTSDRVCQTVDILLYIMHNPKRRLCLGVSNKEKPEIPRACLVLLRLGRISFTPSPFSKMQNIITA